jgi:zinc/manganese transport system substrate-binding protein
MALGPALALAACSPSSSPDVVGADGVLCDLTQRLAGPDLQVVCLLQPGDDPHQFHLSPRQSQDLKGARLVLINGYGLTPALAKQTKAFAVAERAVPNSPWLEPSTSHDEAKNQPGQAAEIHAGTAPSQGDRDPHVWHDPIQASAMVKLVAQKLEALKPAARGRIAGRATAMVAVLQRLDRWNRQQFATIARPSPLATGHHAFASLARAYGLGELPVVESLGSSQSLRPQAFESVLAAIKRQQVTMLFAETLPPSRSLQRISTLSGVPIAPAPLVADGLAKAESPQLEGSSNLVATLTANTCLIVNGFQGHCDQVGLLDLVQQWTAIP